MSKNELTPQKLIDNLKEKVKVEFVKLVPEEEWDDFIKRIITEFKEENLRNEVRKELEQIVKDILKKHLREITELVWDNTEQRQVINAELRNFILAIAPEFLSRMISGSIYSALEHLKYQQ